MIDIALDGSASTFREVESIIERIRNDAEIHFATLELHPDTELSIVLCDNEIIEALNEKWNEEKHPTDVLSFPQFQPDDTIPSDVPSVIGDIVISLEYAEGTLASEHHKARIESELDEQLDDWDIEDEVGFLVIHGLLHLVGYDHHTPEHESAMRGMEHRLWSATAS